MVRCAIGSDSHGPCFCESVLDYLLFEVGPLESPTFVAVALGLSLVTLTASLILARRASTGCTRCWRDGLSEGGSTTSLKRRLEVCQVMEAVEQGIEPEGRVTLSDAFHRVRNLVDGPRALTQSRPAVVSEKQRPESSPRSP